MNKFIKILLNYFLGPLLFVVLSYALYRQVIAQPNLPERWEEIKESWHHPYLWLAVLLMFVNWGIEARKWQVLIRHLQPLGFITALKSVFAGCSVTMLMPNRIGEYGGRILYINENNRLRAISVTILGSMAQLFITLVVGWLGLNYFLWSGNGKAPGLPSFLPGYTWSVLWWATALVMLLIGLLYLRVGFLIGLMRRVKLLEKAVKYIALLQGFSRKELLRILLLSFIRYLVFILQFILVLKVMHADIPLVLCFWALSVFYLVMAMAPTIGFTELPLRAAASVQLLSAYSSNILGIQAASLVIWLVNLVIPALIGSLLILGIKILKENEEKAV